MMASRYQSADFNQLSSVMPGTSPGMTVLSKTKAPAARPGLEFIR
jgi:hypothetical protein